MGGNIPPPARVKIGTGRPARPPNREKARYYRLFKRSNGINKTSVFVILAVFEALSAAGRGLFCVKSPLLYKKSARTAFISHPPRGDIIKYIDISSVDGVQVLGGIKKRARVGVL